MYMNLFTEFMASTDTLRVYQGDKLVFSSKGNMLVPLIEYIARYGSRYPQAAIFDKIMGNAAALLAVVAGCSEAYSPLGSELAVSTLALYGIKYHLTEIVSGIRKPDGEECPMERLSRGKKPEEFYELMRQMASKKE